MTYTYAILDVSPAFYEEVRSKLDSTGYQHAFHQRPEGEVIDMHGIALRAETVFPKATDRCARCGYQRGFHGPVLAEAGDPQCSAFVETMDVPAFLRSPAGKAAVKQAIAEAAQSAYLLTKARELPREVLMRGVDPIELRTAEFKPGSIDATPVPIELAPRLEDGEVVSLDVVSGEVLQSEQPGAVPGAVDQPEEARMLSVKIGDPIIFMDQKARRIHALVSENWGQDPQGDDHASDWKRGEQGPTINVVFVDLDPTKRDSYGRQIKRETSVPHFSGSTAPGFWWALPEEL